MFKKGQLVRSKSRGRNLYVVVGPTANPRKVRVRWLKNGNEGVVLSCLFELIGNNYKEKPRDAIPERRDSYK